MMQVSHKDATFGARRVDGRQAGDAGVLIAPGGQAIAPAFFLAGFGKSFPFRAAVAALLPGVGVADPKFERRVRSWARAVFEMFPIEDTARALIRHHHFNRLSGSSIHQPGGDAMLREVLIAISRERHKHRPEIVPFLRQDVFVARRPIGIKAPLQKPRFDQGLKPSGEHVRRDIQARLELFEACEPRESVTQDQHGPPFAHPIQGARNGTRHASQAFVLHAARYKPLTCEMIASRGYQTAESHLLSRYHSFPSPNANLRA